MAERTHVYRPDRDHGFTARGVQILQGLIDGKSKTEIADEFGIRMNTMTQHLERIKRGRLGEMALYLAIGEAIRAGLLDTSRLPVEYDQKIIDKNRRFADLVLGAVDFRDIDVEMEWHDDRASHFATGFFQSLGIRTKYQFVAMAEVERLRAGNV